MNKKDRIAIVVSIVYLTVPLTFTFYGSILHDFAGFTLLPLILYWGWRFIKGDISFLGQDKQN